VHYVASQPVRSPLSARLIRQRTALLRGFCPDTSISGFPNGGISRPFCRKSLHVCGNIPVSRRNEPEMRFGPTAWPASQSGLERFSIQFRDEARRSRA